MSSPTTHTQQYPWSTPAHAVAIHDRFVNNKSYRRIENDTGIPFNTARNWYIKYQDDPTTNRHRRTHDNNKPNNRGAPLKITDVQVREMELILEARDDDCPVETKALTWEQLGFKAGLEGISARTIQRRMGLREYYKYIACRRGWVNKASAKRRVE